MAQVLSSTGMWQSAFSANPLEQRGFYELPATDKVRRQQLTAAALAHVLAGQAACKGSAQHRAFGCSSCMAVQSCKC